MSAYLTRFALAGLACALAAPASAVAPGSNRSCRESVPGRSSPTSWTRCPSRRRGSGSTMLTHQGWGILVAAAVLVAAAPVRRRRALHRRRRARAARDRHAHLRARRPTHLRVRRTLTPTRVPRRRHRPRRGAAPRTSGPAARRSWPSATRWPAPGAPGSTSSRSARRAARAAYRLPDRARAASSPSARSTVEVADPFGLAGQRRAGAPASSSPSSPTSTSSLAPPGGGDRDPLGGRRAPPLLGRQGDEFYAIREYVVGDDLRRVHWPSTARHDELMVRQDEMPWQDRTTVVLDVRRASHTEASLERAVSAAASVVTAAYRVAAPPRLLASDGVDAGLGNSIGHVEAIMEYLATVDVAGHGSLRAVLEGCGARRRPACSSSCSGGPPGRARHPRPPAPVVPHGDRRRHRGHRARPPPGGRRSSLDARATPPSRRAGAAWSARPRRCRREPAPSGARSRMSVRADQRRPARRRGGLLAPCRSPRRSASPALRRLVVAAAARLGRRRAPTCSAAFCRRRGWNVGLAAVALVSVVGRARHASSSTARTASTACRRRASWDAHVGRPAGGVDSVRHRHRPGGPAHRVRRRRRHRRVDGRVPGRQLRLPGHRRARGDRAVGHLVRLRRRLGADRLRVLSRRSGWPAAGVAYALHRSMAQDGARWLAGIRRGTVARCCARRRRHRRRRDRPGLIVGPLLPGAGQKGAARHPQPADSGTRQTVSPLVDIRGRIVDRSDVEAFTVMADGKSYWRLTALDEFDGRIWTSKRTTATPRASSAAGSRPQYTTPVTQDITITRPRRDLAARPPTRPTRIDSAGDVRYDAETSSLVTRRATWRAGHRVLGRVGRAEPQPGRADSGDRPAPSNIADELPEPAGQLPGQAAASRPADHRRTSHHAVREGARPAGLLPDTSPTTSNVPRRQLDERHRAFLEASAGYCEQFAGTFAAFARSLGLPARVAVGFTPGELRGRRPVPRPRQARPRLARGVLHRHRLGAVRADADPRRPRRPELHRRRSRSRRARPPASPPRPRRSPAGDGGNSTVPSSPLPTDKDSSAASTPRLRHAAASLLVGRRLLVRAAWHRRAGAARAGRAVAAARPAPGPRCAGTAAAQAAETGADKVLVSLARDRGDAGPRGRAAAPERDAARVRRPAGARCRPRRRRARTGHGRATSRWPPTPRRRGRRDVAAPTTPDPRDGGAARSLGAGRLEGQGSRWRADPGRCSRPLPGDHERRRHLRNPVGASVRVERRAEGVAVPLEARF